jgi:hypothetical protein
LTSFSTTSGTVADTLFAGRNFFRYPDQHGDLLGMVIGLSALAGRRGGELTQVPTALWP